MNKKLSQRITLILLPLLILAFLTFLNFTINAGTANAADVSLDIDAVTTTGGWVGQQVEIWSSTNAWVDALNRRWNPNTQLTVTFAGSPVIITNANDDPVTLVTNSSGLIPRNTYYFRVPKAIRGLNQIVISGQGLAGGQPVTNSVAVNFYIATGIGVTRGSSPLPDWSEAAEKVGRKLIIYGTHFGMSGTDSGIAVSWDGTAIASGLSADSDGRWETTITIPETTAGSHIISTTSLKLQSQGIRKPDGTMNPSVTSVSDTFRVKPSFILDKTNAFIGDTVGITGYGWAGTTPTTDVTITITILWDAISRIAPTIPEIIKTGNNGSFSGSFIIPELPIISDAYVNVRVADSKGNIEVAPMTISIRVPVPSQISPSNGATIFTVTPAFSWSAVTVATPPVLYDLQVSTNSFMATTMINRTNLATNTYTLLASESLATGTWYWRVRARDSASPPIYSAWSSPPWSFNVTSAPPTGAWSIDPTQNTPVSVAAYDQTYPQIASDGSGGAIITWQDNRSGNWDIYAQRLNASGVPQWTANGVLVSTAPDQQMTPQIASDGAGGAIITWHDKRSGDYDIYAQRLNASGVSQWTANGVLVSTAAERQRNPQITSDGAGGAIITWHDNRIPFWDIYAQKLNSSGIPQWTANGVAVSAATNSQLYPQIISDGTDGAIITWQDNRSGTNYDIYAQRLNASGVPQWIAHGVAVSISANNQESPQIVSDGAGGAIITWYDYRSGTGSDIYAQRLNASGAPQWTANGMAVSTASNYQRYPQIIYDGAGGGAIITWEDIRDGSNYHIYAQRLNSNGTSQWIANGVPVSIAANSRYLPQIISDGAGGAIITWHDNRSGTNYDIYAQRLNSSGVPLWTANGVAVSTASNDQWYPQIVSDGAGGAIITWHDYRSGSNFDIYAQRITSLGNLGADPSEPTPPPTPAPQSPANGATINTATPTFTWSAVDDIPSSPPVYYDLWIATSASMALPAREKTNLATNTYTLTPIEALAGGVYYWSVRARDSASPIWNYSAWSSPSWSFAVIDTTPPLIPGLSYPANSSTINTGTPTFTWSAVTDSQSPPVLYDLQVATMSSMVSPLINNINLATTNYTLSVAEALAPGSYWWRVRARDSYAAPNYSPWASASFTIDTASPIITLIRPNGNESWEGGRSQIITWSATDINMANNPIILAYATDGVTWVQIATNEPNDGSFIWNVPFINSTTVKVRVNAVDKAGNSASDISDANFIITEPAILAYYRSLGNDTNKVETVDLLRAADDWIANIIPAGFLSPITMAQLLALADEWLRTP